MNDVFAVIMICLALDFCAKEEELTVNKIYRELHSNEYFWSESYFMYEAMMRMGVCGIYFREGVIVP